MPSRSDKDKVAAVRLCVAAALSMLIVLENFPHRLVAEVFVPVRVCFVDTNSVCRIVVYCHRILAANVTFSGEIRLCT